MGNQYQLKRWVILFILSAILTPGILLARENNKKRNIETRYVRSRSINVYEKPETKSRLVGSLKYLESVSVILDEQTVAESGVWLKIIAPVEGYILQKKLISKSPPASDESVDSMLTDQVTKSEADGSQPPMTPLEKPVSDPKKHWLGAGLGVFVLPSQSGLSGSLLSTQDLVLEFVDEGTWQTQLRFGASLLNFSGTHSLVALNLYGVYRHDFDVEVFSGFDIFVLGGLFLSLSNFSGSVSGSSSGFGTIFGAGSYVDLTRYGFSSLMKPGFQLTFNTGRTSVNGASQNIGSTQLQIFAVWTF